MRFRIRLTKPATGRRLTLTGWLLVLLLLLCAVVSWAFTIQKFLSPRQPLSKASIMMVEGFLPDYALQEAANEFKSGDYDLLITTGQQISEGSFLSEYHSLAEVAFEILKHQGVDSLRLYAAPARLVMRDRSVENARAGFENLKELGVAPCRVNVVSLSVHSRRSWKIYRQVGEQYGFETGIIAMPDSTYSETEWWKSSRGIRAVIPESLGYYYNVLFGLSD
ncbi:MAG: hypothetical protein CVU06_13945 [Bacteroidetes bacterium HGW-Bacteroidetes-22]|nr:MAG: hypothetical protein CVU06_13945 [Bacteroidetes bacterium HGW-Bacteroidetes-22]